MDQEQLATAIGVARNTVGNAENGRTEPRTITLNAWALATGVPLEWLVNGTTEAISA
jgi:transcriptional regulator with XRE-family HTH domain